MVPHWRSILEAHDVLEIKDWFADPFIRHSILDPEGFQSGLVFALTFPEYAAALARPLRPDHASLWEGEDAPGRLLLEEWNWTTGPLERGAKELADDLWEETYLSWLFQAINLVSDPLPVISAFLEALEDRSPGQLGLECALIAAGYYHREFSRLAEGITSDEPEDWEKRIVAARGVIERNPLSFH